MSPTAAPSQWRINVANDPDEMNDLAEDSQYAGKLEEMKGLLQAEMERQDDPLLKTNSNRDRQNLFQALEKAGRGFSNVRKKTAFAVWSAVSAAIIVNTDGVEASIPGG